MPQLIQSSPQGLLSYLDINLGDHPKTIEDALRGSVDLSSMYYLLKRESIEATVAAAAAPGNTASITMPQREVWAVFGMGALGNAPTVAGVVMQFDFSYRLRQSNATVTPTMGMSSAITSVGTTDRNAFGFQFPTPLLFPGGSRFFCVVSTPVVAAGTYNLAFQIDFARLTI